MLNAATGVPPFMLAYGRIPRGPLSVLKETWINEKRELFLSLGKSATQYLQELKENLEVGLEYTHQHSDVKQANYAQYYNRGTRDK